MAFEITWPDAGELVRRITIKTWLDVPSALTKGVDHTFDAGISRWAKRDPMRGVAYWSGQQIGEEITDIWWLRYGDGTKPEDLGGEKVIEHNGRRFRIIRAMNAGDAQRFTMVWAKDLGAIL